MRKGNFLINIEEEVGEGARQNESAEKRVKGGAMKMKKSARGDEEAHADDVRCDAARNEHEHSEAR
jgi:hypothetical protein